MNSQEFNQQDLSRIKQLCDDAGMKLTHQRLEIYKELLAVMDHPSAERVHKRLQKRLPTIAIDTVYRTLATFTEFGILKKLNVSNDRTLFDINIEPHHHFVCTHCKAVEDIYWHDFDKTTLPEAVTEVGQVQSRHLELHGICNRCMNEKGQ
ncbi:MAG: Fur family transcriptional regulator [Thermodesulfobacteriota bacterium]